MGQPKALVADSAGSWLLRGVATLRDGGCDRVTVVLGAQVSQARALLDGEDVRVVVADDWAEGMGASLRAGLRALAESDDDAAVVSLVDLPDLVPEVVRRVVARGGGAGPAALGRASFAGEPGHPGLPGRDHSAGPPERAARHQGAPAHPAPPARLPVERAP